MIGREAVDRGVEDEAQVMGALRHYGWGVCAFGQGAWNPDENPAGDGRLIAAIRLSTSPARWAPDLITATQKGVHLIEVIRCARENVALEQAKLEANDLWSVALPVFYVNAATGASWPHRGWDWEAEALGPVLSHHRGNGSGDPYRLFRREGLGRPFHEVFGSNPWP